MARIIRLDEAEHVDHSIVTVGTFDGVHAGHRVLIRKVVEKAREQKGRSVIITFDPHPRSIINSGRGNGIRLLTTLEERCELLAEIGIDEMVVIPFDRDFSLISSETFIREYIWKRIGVSEFVIGYDHQFGRNREGSIETAQKLGRELNFGVYVVSKQEVGDNAVSSTAIRKALLEEGDVQLAATLLQRLYLLNGTVVHGDKRGKQIGYPTANIQPDHPKKAIPKKGVYAVKVRVGSEYYKGMMNIGVRPTFQGEEETLEVHLLDFHRDIYGSQIQVRFVQRIREERKFSDLESLKEQLKRDRDVCEEVLAEEL